MSYAPTEFYSNKLYCDEWNNSPETTSKLPNVLIINGDTLRITTPRKPSEDGKIGEICWDENFLYVCVGDNKWKSVNIN